MAAKKIVTGKVVKVEWNDSDPTGMADFTGRKGPFVETTFELEDRQGKLTLHQHGSDQAFFDVGKVYRLEVTEE